MKTQVRIGVILSWLLLLCTSLWCQEKENDGIFAFAFDKNGRYSTSEGVSPAKYKRARQVFEDLVEAKGVRNMAKPRFIMDNAERRPAWTKPGDAVVVLEEKAYDLCMLIGPDSLNALAALLAHEIIHYYEKHDWKKHFISRNPDIDKVFSDDNQGQNMDLEFQADYLGGLLSHMAGYNTLGVMPALLSEIYSAYNLTYVEDVSYPTLEERRSIARNSDIQLTKFSRVFDMSLYLTASGQYDLARAHLEFLLIETQFQGREIYNNIGVLSGLMAMDKFSASELKFHFPLELELSTRMSTRSGEDEERKVLMEDALYNFKNALLLDEDFSPGYLNLATIHCLRDELLDAEYFATKALDKFESAGSEPGISDTYVILGIIQARKGNKSVAEDYFTRANSPLGRKNLCLLHERTNCLESVAQNPPFRMERVDDVNLNRLYSRIMQDKEQPVLSIDLDEFSSFHTIAKPQSEILVYLNNRNLGEYAFFQIIKDTGVKFKGSIEIGMHSTTLLDIMGLPNQQVNSHDKSLWVYRDDNVLFIVDSDQKIKEWSLFKLSI